MNVVSQRTAFERFYIGEAPWDGNEPQGQFVAVADQVTGPVLDAGCGTRENALFFAARGHRVIGIDFVEAAIRRARVKAAERGLAVEFLVKDALALGDWAERFASAIDCGLFHALSDDDRRRYVEGLSVVLEPGGRLFLLCRNDDGPWTEGPRQISRQEIHDAFAEGWEVESVKPSRLAGNPEPTDLSPSQVRTTAWFAIVRREECETFERTEQADADSGRPL